MKTYQTYTPMYHDNKWYKREASAYGRRHFVEDIWKPFKGYHPSYGFFGYTD